MERLEIEVCQTVEQRIETKGWEMARACRAESYQPVPFFCKLLFSCILVHFEEILSQGKY